MRRSNHYPRYMGQLPMDGVPWKKLWDIELSKNIRDGYTIDNMATHFGRTRGAIAERLKRNEPIFNAYWSARCAANNNGQGVSFYQDLAFMFEPPEPPIEKQHEQETMVEIKIEGKDLLDAIDKKQGQARMASDQSVLAIMKEQKEWVREELTSHIKGVRQTLIAAVLINVAVLVVTAAIILY